MKEGLGGPRLLETRPGGLSDHELRFDAAFRKEEFLLPVFLLRTMSVSRCTAAGGFNRAGLHDLGHYPVVLSEPPNSLEALTFEH